MKLYFNLAERTAATVFLSAGAVLGWRKSFVQAKAQESRVSDKLLPMVEFIPANEQYAIEKAANFAHVGRHEDAAKWRRRAGYGDQYDAEPYPHHNED